MRTVRPFASRVRTTDAGSSVSGASRIGTTTAGQSVCEDNKQMMGDGRRAAGDGERRSSVARYGTAFGPLVPVGVCAVGDAVAQLLHGPGPARLMKFIPSCTRLRRTSTQPR